MEQRKEFIKEYLQGLEDFKNLLRNNYLPLIKQKLTLLKIIIYL